MTALTHTRASALPIVSIAFAARSTISRIASISMRALAITSVFLPRRASGLPNASRLRPRRTISSRARSAAPIERMQWWMRPGPRRTWEISKPRPSPSRMFVARHAHVGEAQVHVAVRRVVLAEHVHRRRGSPRPGVSIGTRICDWRWCGGPSGLVCTIVIMILQRGSPAPEM